MTPKEYQKALDEIEQAQRTADQLDGAEKQLLRQLTEEFEVTTVAEGEKLLKRLTKEGTEATNERDAKAQQWIDNWRGKL